MLKIHAWLEQHSGVSYEFGEDIVMVSGDVIFTDPFEWRISVENILENLSDALDVINKNSRYIPDDLPDKDSMKKTISSYVIGELLNILNSIKQKLHIEQVDINDYDVFNQHINAITSLLDMLMNNSIEDISNHDLFEKFEEENDNMFTELLHVHKNDLTNMHFTVSSIRQDYFEMLEELEDRS